MSSLSMICAAKSEQGRRSSNDDCVLVDPEAGLYVVCDGARGRFGGHTAAELAVDTFRGCLNELRQVDIISPAAEKMVESMALKAHRRILAAQQQDSSLEGTTTTMAAVLHRGAQVLVSHVGDTRIYLHREGELQLLTVDHNLENYLLENPNFRPKVQLSGKTLVRALGLKTSALTVDHKSVNLQKGDKLLINTDGLTDSLPGMTMRHIMATLDLRSEQDVADSLVRAALNHGSMDNISVILLHSTDRAVDGPKTTIFEVASLTSTASVKSVVLGWLTFLDEPQRGRVVTLEAKTVIGADSNCKIVVAEDYVSARHAEVLRTEHGYVLRDLGSTNGSFINNVSAKNEYCLVDGDVIRIGSRELVFKSLRVDQ
jgi:PPM family protein phosphatase